MRPFRRRQQPPPPAPDLAAPQGDQAVIAAIRDDITARLARSPHARLRYALDVIAEYENLTREETP